MNRHPQIEPTPTRQDRRVQRTRRHLREALMQLILERGYDAVTIEDITERADLGRTTFYLHYRDKEELLLESIEATAQELYQQINPSRQVNAVSGLSTGAIYPQTPVEQPTEPVAAKAQLPAARLEGLRAIDRVFAHAAANSLLYRIILKGGAASKVRRYILDFLSEAATPLFQQTLAGEHAAPVPVEAIAGYFAASLLGFMTWWLEQELPYPPELASAYYTQLFLSGLRGLLGEDNRSRM